MAFYPYVIEYWRTEKELISDSSPSRRVTIAADNPDEALALFNKLKIKNVYKIVHEPILTE